MKPRDDRATLTPTIVRLVCLGPRAVPPLNTLAPADLAMVRYLFQAGPHAYATMWEEHAAFLRAEAARLQLRPPANAGTEFFGEQIARREQAQREKARR